MTGEFQAQGAAASGSFVRAPASVAPNSLGVRGPAGTLQETLVGDGSVSVSMTGGVHPPSVTPMLGSSGGAASLAPPDFRRRTGGARMVGALVGGAALALVVGSFILRRPASDPPPTAATVPPPAAPSPSPAAPPSPAPWNPAPAPAPTTVSVHFVSDPPGASIRENGAEVCAATPCDHDFPADTNLEHKIVVARIGYRPESRTVRSSDGQVAVTLSRLAAKWTPPPPSTPKAPESAPATPQGFKEIPY
jgi:hypothetical protein